MSVNIEDRMITVLGAGPVGCLLGALLARRGARVTLYEKRPDLRRVDQSSGRSINLVLTERGLSGLDTLGARQRVTDTLTVPVLGRMMHDLAGQQHYQPYGKDDSEHNHSVSRGALNQFLLSEAEAAGARICFEHEVQHIDLDQRTLTLRRLDTQDIFTCEAPVVIGADGAPSQLRQALVAQRGFQEHVSFLEHSYKELTFPVGADGEPIMAGHALHIWPRGEHMLMGLANLDGSFTGTVYLADEGPGSFAQLQDAASVRAFFEAYYPDALAMMPELEDDFLGHPAGRLGTVRCSPWHLEDQALLLGDAAHAIVPFFGQGLNCGFEDCEVFNVLLDECDTLGEVFKKFDALRKPNADAIAEMALDNFVEMRDRVGDPHFLLQKQVERRIEQELGGLYRSRYATVMYSAVPYHLAHEAGHIQSAILNELTQDLEDASQLDMERARALITAQLTPFYTTHRINLASELGSKT